MYEPSAIILGYVVSSAAVVVLLIGGAYVFFQPKEINETKEHFTGFKPGQTAYLLGKPVIITKACSRDEYDDEHDMPYIEVAYYDHHGQFHTHSIYPREARVVLKLSNETEVPKELL